MRVWDVATGDCLAQGACQAADGTFMAAPAAAAAALQPTASWREGYTATHGTRDGAGILSGSTHLGSRARHGRNADEGAVTMQLKVHDDAGSA